MSSLSLLRELQTPQCKTLNEFNKIQTPNYTCDHQLRMERERLKTFENWPLAWMDKNTLAASGMFYTGVKDQTKCYFCEVIIGRWEYNDDPVQEHLHWSPNCPLMKRFITKNVPINEKALDLLLPPAKQISCDTPPATTTWKDVPSQDYSIKTVRLQSFAHWPRSMKQRPEELVEAGFYYKGVGDSVVCFSCRGGLKDWEGDDDPWEQHALWMGFNCPYLKLMKGEQFIQSVHKKFRNSQSKNSKNETNQNAVMEPKTETSPALNDQKVCKICYDKECNTAYAPCGHVVACTECALAVKECPVCRRSIENVVRLYFS